MLSVRNLKITPLSYFTPTCWSSNGRKPLQQSYYTETDSKEGIPEEKLGGFAKSFQRFAEAGSVQGTPQHKTFTSLLRNSKFIDLGDPQNKIVEGTIYHIVNDDLYIDFGWKFHCVCPRPAKRGTEYVRGATVKLRVNDLEMSTLFLGATKDLTLLEADCTLLGILHSPAKE